METKWLLVKPIGMAVDPAIVVLLCAYWSTEALIHSHTFSSTHFLWGVFEMLSAFVAAFNVFLLSLAFVIVGWVLVIVLSLRLCSCCFDPEFTFSQVQVLL